MKQRLGPKKHRQCEVIAGRTYSSCWTSGSWGHGIVECVWPSQEGEPTDRVRPMTADWVDLRARTVTPKYVKGERVS